MAALKSIAWLIDIGNTRIKWASIEGGLFKKGSVISYKNITQQQLINQIRLMSGVPGLVYIASVGDVKFLSDFKDALRKLFQVNVIQLGSQDNSAGVINGYDDYSKLGVDRWLALVEAFNLQSSHVMVVDAGSALTIDVVDKTGQHQGGLIAPGLLMMRDTLVSKTAKLDYSEVNTKRASYDGYETNTQDAINLGTLRMMAAFISAEAVKIQKEKTGPIKFYLTGGDSEALLPLLDFTWIHVPDLVLHGMHRAISNLNAAESVNI